MYVTGSDAYSQNQMSEDRIGGQSPPELREGLPDTERGGNQGQDLFCTPKARFPRRAAEPFAYSGDAPILRP
jgi:hypothetical protein